MHHWAAGLVLTFENTVYLEGYEKERQHQRDSNVRTSGPHLHQGVTPAVQFQLRSAVIRRMEGSPRVDEYTKFYGDYTEHRDIHI